MIEGHQGIVLYFDMLYSAVSFSMSVGRLVLLKSGEVKTVIARRKLSGSLDNRSRNTTIKDDIIHLE